MATSNGEARVRALLKDTDAGDTDRLLTHFTADMELRFGNGRPVGRDAFRAMSDKVNASLEAIDHEIVALWDMPEDETVIVEMIVHYFYRDGRAVALPSCSIFRLSGGLVRSYRIFMDSGPALANAAFANGETPDA